MSDEYRRIEVITGTARRRRRATAEKLRIVDESFEPGATVSEVARRNGVAPNLLFRWRRLMTEGGTVAVGVDEDVVGGSEVRRLEERVRAGKDSELSRLILLIDMGVAVARSRAHPTRPRLASPYRSQPDEG